MNCFGFLAFGLMAAFGSTLSPQILTQALADPPKPAESPSSTESRSPTPYSSGGEPEQEQTTEAALHWQPLAAHWQSCPFGGEGEVKVTDWKPKDRDFVTSKFITMEFGDPLTGVRWNGEFPRQDYEIALEARRTDGFDFLLGLTFPIDEQSVTLVLGGWGGGITGISSIDDRDASENETTLFKHYKNNQWYDVRARVDPFGITCWVDDDKLIEVDRRKHKFGIRVEMEPCEPLGIAAFQSVTEYRNIRFRKLTNKEIAAAKTKKKEWEAED